MTSLIAPSEVLAGFCQATGISADDLCRHDRSRLITRRRHEAMYLLRHLSLQSISGIATLMQRDEATVHAGIANVADAMASDRGYADCVQNLAEFIRKRLRIATPAVPGADVMRIAAIGVLADANLSDTDARQAALTLSRSGGEARP